MARWRLQSAHYLNVPGTEWDQVEIRMDGKRRARKTLQVHLYLDPKDPSDHNYPGEIVVAYAGKAQGADYIFVGEPTPEMEPLDDEAREITEALMSKWMNPIDSLPATGEMYSDVLLRKFEDAINRIMTVNKGAVTSHPGEVADNPMVSALMQQVERLTKQVEMLTSADEPRAPAPEPIEPLPSDEPAVGVKKPIPAPSIPVRRAV